MHSVNTRTRKSGLSVLSQPRSLSNIYERDTDSGLDEGSEEDNHTCLGNIHKTEYIITNKMRGYDIEFQRDLDVLTYTDIDDNNNNNNDELVYDELDKNIESLEEEIIRCCEEIKKSVEKRRDELLSHVQEIRKQKLKQLKQDFQGGMPMIKHTYYKRDLNLGSCLRFVTDENLKSIIQEYGIIDEGRAAAKNSIAHGIGLKYCIANEPTQFELETYNISGEKSWVEQDKIEVLIKRDNKEYQCVVQNKCNGMYSVLYELQEPGQYSIHIHVNGRHISDSPYLCDVFEKCDLKFLYTQNTPDEWTFQNGDKSALVEKTEIQRTSKLYSDIYPPAKAWKVRVTTACRQIKLKFGYSNTSSGIPDLYDEYYCKFNLNDLITYQPQLPSHHTHDYRRSRRTHDKKQRKQSTFHRSSLTFTIFQDTESNTIYAAVEGTNHTKTAEYTDVQGVSLVPFIGIKHFCKNAGCPRPMLVFV